MNKIISSFAIALLLNCAAFAQEDDQKEASVLKSEIKILEKAISDTEKEIVKFEKSVVKTRPEAEQAKRDQINITEMMEIKRREAETFQYDKKKAELKTQQKALNTTAKTQSKLQKALDKNEVRLKDTDTQYELAKTQQTRTQAALDAAAIETAGVSKEEQEAMRAKLKSKEAVPAEELEKAGSYQQKTDQQAALNKELGSLNKSVVKSESLRAKIQEERAKMLDEKKVTDEQHSIEAASVTALEEELKMYDPKMMQKEIEKLSKDADEARITAEKLQLEVDQVEVVIKEKHDYIEMRKIEMRDKESALLKK